MAKSNSKWIFFWNEMTNKELKYDFYFRIRYGLNAASHLLPQLVLVLPSRATRTIPLLSFSFPVHCGLGLLAAFAIWSHPKLGGMTEVSGVLGEFCSKAHSLLDQSSPVCSDKCYYALEAQQHFADALCQVSLEKSGHPDTYFWFECNLCIYPGMNHWHLQ